MTSNLEKGRRRFAGELDTVSIAIQKVRERFPDSLRAIGGECWAPRYLGRSWYFDLATLNGRSLDVLACRITGDDFNRIDGYLRRQGSSLSECMREGMELEVQGKIFLNDDGAICLDVTKIAQNFTRTGEMHREDRRTLDALRLEGVASSRMGRSNIHCGADGARPEFPTEFGRLLVIASRDSHGLADFKNRVRTIEKHGPLVIDYLEFRRGSQAAPEMLMATLAESASKGYDLILIVRGGGHWSKLRVFDHRDIALAIRRCPIPIATAIGHKPDISMADRAANFSFVTPTAAGEAVKREMDRRRFSASKQADGHGRSSLRAPSAHTGRRSGMTPTGPSIAELRQAKAEADGYKLKAKAALQAHTDDLLELADRRVRLISRLMIPLYLAVGTLALLFQQPLLEFLSLGSSAAAQILYPTGAVAQSVVAVWLQQRRHKLAAIPSTRAMKSPPQDLQEWRRMAKRAVTIRGMRNLLANRP